MDEITCVFGGCSKQQTYKEGKQLVITSAEDAGHLIRYHDINTSSGSQVRDQNMLNPQRAFFFERCDPPGRIPAAWSPPVVSCPFHPVFRFLLLYRLHWRPQRAARDLCRTDRPRQGSGPACRHRRTRRMITASFAASKCRRMGKAAPRTASTCTAWLVCLSGRRSATRARCASAPF